jgi:DNA gyrase subunit B
LKSVDAVRKRPGMYIGVTDEGPDLHNMVYEVVNNAANEGLAGYADRIELILNPDGSCTVRDNGRGIPTDIVEGEGISGAEFIMTRLHARGKFGQEIFGGLHGVGVCVVNALSEWLDLHIWREDKEYFLRFLNGEPQAPLAVVADAKGKHGTDVTFLPSSEIFPEMEFNLDILENYLRRLAPRDSNLSVVLTDCR